MHDAVEQAVAEYVAAQTRRAQIVAELERLTEEAEALGDYTEADDYRNYRYAEATEEALGAAEQLLAWLGYGVTVSS